MLWPSNASIFNGVGGAPMPAKFADVSAALPHVAVVSPVIQNLKTDGKIEMLYGIDYRASTR